MSAREPAVACFGQGESILIERCEGRMSERESCLNDIGMVTGSSIVVR